MNTIARIISKKDNTLTVKFIRPEGECHRCGACSAFNFIPIKSSVNLQIDNPDKDYNIGEIIILSASDKFYYWALFLAFIMPLFFLIGGAAIFSLIFNEAAGVLGGFILMFAYLFIGLKYSEKYFIGIFKITGKLKNIEDACSL